MFGIQQIGKKYVQTVSFQEEIARCNCSCIDCATRLQSLQVILIDFSYIYTLHEIKMMPLIFWWKKEPANYEEVE